MILFISSWHLMDLLGVFLGFAALLGVWGILWAARAALENRQDEDQAKHEKRSAAARKGHETRKAKRVVSAAASDPVDMHWRMPDELPDDEVERVLRQLDEQAEAKR